MMKFYKVCDNCEVQVELSHATTTWLKMQYEWERVYKDKSTMPITEYFEFCSAGCASAFIMRNADILNAHKYPVGKGNV